MNTAGQRQKGEIQELATELGLQHICVYDAGNWKTERNSSYVTAYCVNVAVADREQHPCLSGKLELTATAANSHL